MRSLISHMAILFRFTVAGAFLAVLLSFALPSFSYDRRLLPSPPVAAEKIVGVELGGLYQAYIAIRGVDGNTYASPILGSNIAWELGSVSDDAFDQPCSRRNKSRLQAVAGDIIDCREFQAFGDSCPSAMQSFAVSSTGQLWELNTPQPCVLFAVQVAVFFGVVGFILGLVFLAIRRLFASPNEVV